jgi:hypothetical protein
MTVFLELHTDNLSYSSVVYFASYNYFVGAYNIPVPFMGKCAAGKEHAVSEARSQAKPKRYLLLYRNLQVFSGCAILTSYLFLFIGESNSFSEKMSPCSHFHHTSAAFYQKTYKNKSNVARSRIAAPTEKQNSFGSGNTTAFLAPGDTKMQVSTPQLEKAKI